jgi:hypothetical protein
MENQNKPILYSKLTLMIFSIFSCFISGLLYIQNLRELRKNKYVVLMVLYSIFFPTVLSKVLASAGIPMYYTYIPINLLGGFLLIKPFWEYQLETDNYKSRNALIPAIIVLGLIGLFVVLSFIRRH